MKLSEWAANLQQLVEEGYGDHEVEFEVTDASGEENILYTVQNVKSVESYNGRSMYRMESKEKYEEQEEKDWICFDMV